MFKSRDDQRVFQEMAEADMAREEETRQKLAELIAQKKAEKAEASTRTRGHATRVLRTKTEELRAMLPYFTLGEMVDLLAEGGVHVNYHSLRNFLRKHLPNEYLEYVAIGQAKSGFAPIPEQLADAPISPEEELEVFGERSIKNEGESKPENHAKPKAPSEKIKKAENLSDLQRISRTDVDTSEYE